LAKAVMAAIARQTKTVINIRDKVCIGTSLIE
jgi:hypothetical protein